MSKFPLLTIAIPTYNRANYLSLTINQFFKSKSLINTGIIELIISDDSSPDNTSQIIKKAINDGLNIKYVVNRKNLGSDGNIASCINMAKGEYVLILGDDDLLLDGSVEWIIGKIKKNIYGVICFQAYGYESNYLIEQPKNLGKLKAYSDVGDFLSAIGPLATFTSTCIFNKKILGKIDANKYVGSWFPHLPFIIMASSVGRSNLYFSKFLVAAKRNNSEGRYDFINVFVNDLGKILDNLSPKYINQKAIFSFEKKMIIGYLPFYLFRQRLKNMDQDKNKLVLVSRFKKYWFFWIWLFPISFLPRFLAITYGALITTIGRIYYGDFSKGINFIKNKFRKLIRDST